MILENRFFDSFSKYTIGDNVDNDNCSFGDDDDDDCDGDDDDAAAINGNDECDDIDCNDGGGD